VLSHRQQAAVERGKSPPDSPESSLPTLDVVSDTTLDVRPDGDRDSAVACCLWHNNVVARVVTPQIRVDLSREATQHRAPGAIVASSGANDG
jgi:hypothetical protein